MSLLRKLVSVVVLLGTLSVCSHVYAQPQPGFFGKGDDNSDFTGLYDPFCDLDTCWFEPIHCECPDRPLNSGWFFGYSRMNLNVTRPRENSPVTYDPGPGFTPISSIFTTQNSGSDYKGDWAWGNRFDFGWVSEEGTGLWFVARKLDSPNERLDFDNIDTNLDTGLRLDEEAWGPTFATINGLQMWGFEANKTWRLAPTHNGTVMEPFVGARYVRLRDLSDANTIFSDAAEALTFGPNPPGTLIQRTLVFNYQQARRTTDNDLFGGQFGMRSRWRRGRWQITSDVRGLAFWNHQTRETIADNEVQQETFNGTFIADGSGIAGSGVFNGVQAVAGSLTQEFNQTQSVETNNTFVYGGELNLQAAFEITQGFAITFGGEILAFADGIGRGANGVDDSLVMTGFSMGFTFNR